jgi:hypothetical protein
MRQTATAAMRLEYRKSFESRAGKLSAAMIWLSPGGLQSNFIVARLAGMEDRPRQIGNPRNLGQIR